MAKGFANAGITLAVGTLVTGAIAVAAPVAVAVGVGLAVSAALSFAVSYTHLTLPTIYSV